MDEQRKETEILKKEISELRERMLGSNQKIEPELPIDPESLPASTLGRKLGTIGSKFKSLTSLKDLG